MMAMQMVIVIIFIVNIFPNILLIIFEINRNIDEFC